MTSAYLRARSCPLLCTLANVRRRLAIRRLAIRRLAILVRFSHVRATRLPLPCAVTAGIDGDLEDDLDADVSDGSDGDRSPEDIAVQLAKRAAARAEKRRKEVKRMWNKDMDEQECTAYMNAVFKKSGTTLKQLKSMISKTRGSIVNTKLKEIAHDKMPSLVPKSADVERDGRTYKQSKQLLVNAPAGAMHLGSTWPRPCPLLFGANEHGEPRFLYTKKGAGEDDDQPHPFTAFVDSVASEFKIKEVKPNLVAFLVYTIHQIASTAVPKRGRGKTLGIVKHGEIKDVGHWSGGIERALKFISNRDLCPTEYAASLYLTSIVPPFPLAAA